MLLIMDTEDAENNSSPRLEERAIREGSLVFNFFLFFFWGGGVGLGGGGAQNNFR